MLKKIQNGHSNIFKEREITSFSIFERDAIIKLTATSSSRIGLTPLSNVWVGAWWVGFLVSALLCFVLAVPLLAFPAEMPGSAALRAEKVSEAHGAESSTAAAFSKLREMPRAFRALITNPAFFFLNLAGASEGLLLSGFAAFLPKLIENQFSVAASRAALLMGKRRFRLRSQPVSMLPVPTKSIQGCKI